MDTHGMPVRMFITSDATADCSLGERLIEGLDAEFLLADRGYDTDAILHAAKQQKTQAVVPPKKNRKVQREYDKDLYKLRHFAENAFPALKR